MKRDDAVRFQVTLVNLYRLARQQMHRNRVAAECVQRENIELLTGLTFQGKPRVTDNHICRSLRICEKAESRFREPQYFLVDFINPKVIAYLSIGQKRS